MDTQKFDFITREFPERVSGLAADAVGKWGKMNGQQMVEHVTGFFMVSSGKYRFPLVTPAEHLPKLKEFLLSDKEFRENTKAPVNVVPEEPRTIEYASMQEALAALQSEINDFVKYFTNDPGARTTHPVFGELNLDEWVLLHHKHVTHHLKQFGLMV
jgi:hypothetical protein